jgi:branched-chain amino acid aminotransferase
MPFDDRDGVIWFDGALVPWREAKIHVLTHALHYASSVFEGERIYNGSVFKLTEHSQRLVDSARIMGFEIPYTTAQIDAATRETVKAAGVLEGYVRPLAWRGSEVMGIAAQTSHIHLAIAVWQWPSYFSPEAKMKGINLTWAKYRRPSPECAPTAAKAAGLYMICTISKHEAEAAGYHDALMLDYRGQIAEATGANFFMVVDGKLHTPTPDCFLDGITRRTIIDLARARGIEVVERAIWPDDLKQASEVFLTGTAAEITPVGNIDGLSFTPGPVTKALLADFEALVRHGAKVAAE